MLSHGWKASGSSAESKESAGESSQLALSSMSLQQLQAEKVRAVAEFALCRQGSNPRFHTLSSACKPEFFEAPIAAV